MMMMIQLNEVLFFFGWKWIKASNCKKLLKSLQSRLKLLKNKRSLMATLLRRDIALLLQHGYYHLAISRAEKLVQDENMAKLYGLLDCCCDFLLLNFSWIRKNKGCPNEIVEAMSSLVFASTRCEELPELAKIRELFVRLYRGNFDNSKLVENILTKPVPDDVKYRLVDEINRTLIKSSEPQQQEKFQSDGMMDIIPCSPDTSIFSISPSSSTSSCSISSPEMESFILQNPRIGGITDQKSNKYPEWNMVPYTYTYTNSSSDRSVYSHSSSSPEIESFIVMNPKEGRISKPGSSLESSTPSSYETLYLDEKRLFKLKSSEMQLIPYPSYQSDNNNKDDYRKEEEQAMNYKGYSPTNSRNHLPKKMAELDLGTPPPCKHVHPKLPDHDQLVAQFTAIKRSNLLLANNSKKL